MVGFLTSHDGFAMHFVDDDVVGLAGPRPSDTEVQSYVFVIGLQPIPCVELVSSLLTRIQSNPPFAQLTRPNGTPIWIRGSTVTEIRDPLSVEMQNPPAITRQVIRFAGNSQAVQETYGQLKTILSGAGANSQLFNDGLTDI